MIYKASGLGMPAENWPDAAVSLVPKLNGRLFDAIFNPSNRRIESSTPKRKRLLHNRAPQ
jgi:hypothetical protein